MSSLLTTEQWNEYFDRLEGPEGCDFKEEPDPDDPETPKTTWRCGGGFDKKYSLAILKGMGIEETTIASVISYVSMLGGHCDCEVLFNTIDRVFEDLGVVTR